MDEPWVQAPQDNPVNAYIAASLAARGLALPPPAVSTYSMHVRNHLLATGRFLAVLWECSRRFNTNKDTLKTLPVDLGIPARPVAAIKLKNRTLSPVVELFIEHAKEFAKSMTKPSVRPATRANVPSGGR
jgi:DNA-binding transcriptional LysR family regulator